MYKSFLRGEEMPRPDIGAGMIHKRTSTQMVFNKIRLLMTELLVSDIRSKMPGTKSILILWSIIAVSMFLLQASTLDVLPSLMQDEAQITDYGRLALDPLSRWSVTWWVAGDKPLLLWSYLGPVFAELGYQIGGSSGVGPRMVALIGGFTAAVMALGWLMQRKVPVRVAGLLSMAFLLDPLFTLSQRMARSDSWVIAFCLAACWLLRLSESKNGFKQILLIMFSGSLAAIGLFIWPSALFLLPLILVELFHSIYNTDRINRSLKYRSWLTVYFIVAGLVTSILLILPIQHQIETILDDMQKMVELNVNATETPLSRLFGLFSYQPWAKFVKAFVKTLSPFLPLLALWAVLFKRERGLLLGLILTLILIFATLVYEFRLLYLLPFFLALIGDLFRYPKLEQLRPKIRKLSVAFSIFTVLWSIGVSAFVRTALAYDDGAQRKRSLINEAAKSAIGRGDYKVFLAFTYELYFAGRSLGWQLYTPYIQFSFDDEGNWIRKDDFQPKESFIKLMSEMDYAIFSESAVDDDIAKQLEASGLYYQETIYVGNQAAEKKSMFGDSHMNDIFIWYLRGASNYGPYKLYSRVYKPLASPSMLVNKRLH